MAKELVTLYIPVFIFIVFTAAIYIALKDFFKNRLAKLILRIVFILAAVTALSGPIFTHSFFRNRYPQYFTPQYRTAFRNWGPAITLIEENRNLAEAEQYLLKILELNPRDIKALEWLVKCYLKMKQYAQAEKYLVILLKVDPYRVWALETQHRLNEQRKANSRRNEND